MPAKPTRQTELLNWIMEENRVPSYKEIRARFKIKADPHVHRMLRALVKKGYLEHNPNPYTIKKKPGEPGSSLD